MPRALKRRPFSPPPSFWSQLRGIGLVVLGLAALAYYYSWWFGANQSSLWLLAGFVLALFFGLIQLAGSWAIYLATHRRRSICPAMNQQPLTVDVFVTVLDEALPLVARALAAAVAMHGPHQTWLLDDGHSPARAALAQKLGAGYLVRSDRQDAKAGNINAALAQTDGEIVVIFDVDHAPRPTFLQHTLGCFDRPDVGFVQVMLTFANRRQSWVAAAAADSSLDFYNPTSIGADGVHSTTLIGSNALIRRRALEEIGGYQPGLAEDLATSIAMHAAGWRSVYVPEPLAPGLVPPDLAAWFTQQFKWSRGVFELLLTAYPRLFGRLSLGQRLMYAVRMTYYWIGLFTAAHLLITLVALWRGAPATLQALNDYLTHLLPLVSITLLIRHLALRRWQHPELGPLAVQWQATALVMATWPQYVLAWFMALLRRPVRFRPTPKVPGRPLPWVWMAPQLVAPLLLVIGLGVAVVTTRTPYLLVYGLAAALAATHVAVLLSWWRPQERAASGAVIEVNALSGEPAAPEPTTVAAGGRRESSIQDDRPAAEYGYESTESGH